MNPNILLQICARFPNFEETDLAANPNERYFTKQIEDLVYLLGIYHSEMGWFADMRLTRGYPNKSLDKLYLYVGKASQLFAQLEDALDSLSNDLSGKHIHFP